MSGPAIAMMLLAMAVLWGGLCLAIINLSRSGEGDARDVHRDL
ncbi:MAG: methionine/alanine import family NSS transporter small subunit [Limnobacter sp.]|nr:methionine/alanine import family NSS transporter small subunit [Limnobacter sp.]